MTAPVRRLEEEGFHRVRIQGISEITKKNFFSKNFEFSAGFLAFLEDQESCQTVSPPTIVRTARPFHV